jgi:hypothetical protein
MFKQAVLALALVAVVYSQTLQLPSSFSERIIARDNKAKFCRRYNTGFEDLSEFDGMYSTPDQTGSTWKLQGGTTRSGKSALQGIITQAEDNEHKGYQSIQLFKTTEGVIKGPVYIEFFVNMQIDIKSGQWVTLAEISTDSSDAPGKRYISLSLDSNYKLSLYNVPSQNGSATVLQSDSYVFPRNQWVNITVYVDFNDVVGTAAVWANRNLVSVANINGGANTLAQLHMGLFAQNQITSGNIYNDDLTIYQVIRDGATCDDGSAGTLFTSLPQWAVAPISGAETAAPAFAVLLVALLALFL